MEEKYSIVKEYISEIEKELYDINGTSEKLTELENELYDYADKTETFTFSELVNEFGTPEEIAADITGLNQDLSYTSITKDNKKRNFTIILLIISIIVVVIVCGIQIYNLVSGGEIPPPEKITIIDKSTDN